jgi:hypothetical protein
MVSHNLLYLYGEKLRHIVSRGGKQEKNQEQFKHIATMHSSSYQRCIAVLFIFSLLLQSCRSSSREVMDESSPHSGTSTPAPATASIPSMAIGPREWAQYFGEVGEVPPLPADIDEILESRCPFWPDKQVKDTHLLVLVPEMVNGKSFTLDLLGELVEKPNKGGNKTSIKGIQEALGPRPTNKSYWVLMAHDVLPGSRNKPYDAQEALVAKHAHYEIPGVLEAATAILLHYVRLGKGLYASGPLHTYIRCQSSGAQDTFMVGSFSPTSLKFGKISSSTSREDIGVSCLRKF